MRNGLIWIDKVATDDNLADMGTKQVAPIKKFNRLRDAAMGKTPKLVVTTTVKEILDGKYDGPTRPSTVSTSTL